MSEIDRLAELYAAKLGGGMPVEDPPPVPNGPLAEPMTAKAYVKSPPEQSPPTLPQSYPPVLMTDYVDLEVGAGSIEGVVVQLPPEAIYEIRRIMARHVSVTLGDKLNDWNRKYSLQQKRKKVAVQKSGN